MVAESIPNISVAFNTSFGTSMVNELNNQTCMLNQYALVEATQKLPIICLWLSIAIFVILAVHWIVMPFLYRWKYHELMVEALPGMAFALSIWLPLILMYFTLDFNEATFHKLENILYIFVIGIIVLTLLFNRRRIIKWFQELKHSQE